MTKGNFEVKKIFKLNVRKLFVVGGVALSDEIERGMILSYEAKDIYQQINSIEVITFYDQEYLLGLTFKYEDDKEIEKLNTLSIGDFVNIIRPDVRQIL